jgi:hypothetical protein
MTVELSATVGVIFGLVAAAMASLIIYGEYRKHRLGRRRLWRMILEGGMTAFIFFVVLAVVAAYWFSRMAQ